MARNCKLGEMGKNQNIENIPTAREPGFQIARNTREFRIQFTVGTIMSSRQNRLKSLTICKNLGRSTGLVR